MIVAWYVARDVWPGYASKFSRHDFTLAQLFACLLVRELFDLSFRRTEALLRDTDWCQRIGMSKPPDHATLCRAFGVLLNRGKVNSMLMLFAHLLEGKLGDMLGMDSTHFDTHHQSRHYEKRCREHQRNAEKKRGRELF